MYWYEFGFATGLLKRELYRYYSFQNVSENITEIDTINIVAKL
jgi:hypothetical protein